MAKKMTKETGEKSAIKDYLKAIGAFYYHNLAGLGVFPGIPDLTAIVKGRVIQIEVKADVGKQSENQKNFQIVWESQGGCYLIGTADDVISGINKLTNTK